MTNHCHSCAAPLHDPAFRSSSNVYCRHCIDAAGNLISREQAVNHLIGWFKTWQPATLSDQQLQRRAEHYLLSMPAWAMQAE